MKLLALDTATEACSAALLQDSEVLLREERLDRGHAGRLLPMVAELLAESGLSLGALDAIAVGRGPGAFTGVRIAIAMGQGLALGAGLPIIAVSDLAALAAAAALAVPTAPVLACLDARLGEVYWSFYALDQPGGPNIDPWRSGFADVREHVTPPADVDLGDGARVTVAGPGWVAYPKLAARLKDRAGTVLPALLPSAREVARLGVVALRAGAAVGPSEVLPVYLRNDVATRSSRPPGGRRRG